jgi:hypothetical protein
MTWKDEEQRMLEEEFSQQTNELTGTFVVVAIAFVLAIAMILAYVGWRA